jgi:hypothetical protein
MKSSSPNSVKNETAAGASNRIASRVVPDVAISIKGFSPQSVV